METNRLNLYSEPRKPSDNPKCPCGQVLTDGEIKAGYYDAISGAKICELCWEQGEPLEGPHE